MRVRNVCSILAVLVFFPLSALTFYDFSPYRTLPVGQKEHADIFFYVNDLFFFFLNFADFF